MQNYTFRPGENGGPTTDIEHPRDSRPWLYHEAALPNHLTPAPTLTTTNKAINTWVARMMFGYWKFHLVCNEFTFVEIVMHLPEFFVKLS